VYELRNRQREVEHHLSAHTKADETFNYTLSVLVGLTSKAAECFARANIEQKRKLLTLIFANLEMQGTTLCYSLRKPFDVLAKLPESEEWRALVDTLRTDYYQDIVALSPAVRFMEQELLAA
jgi:site-specific DNA recombinase